MVTGPHCPGCVQQEHGEAFVAFSGTAASGIMLVGESPWTDEIRIGIPFAGAAGATLDRLLRRAGLSRDEVIVTNAAWCKARWIGWYDAPKRFPEAQLAMEHCRPHLDGLIERLKPRVLVPMGNVALRRVCGVSGIEQYAGYVLDTAYGVPAIPTYHPSFIMQGNQKLSPVAICAFRNAKEIAQHGFTRERPNLLLDPSPSELRDYLAAAYTRLPSGFSLFADLETPESSKLDEEEVDEKGASWTILRASFALEDDCAVSFPWQEPYRSLFANICHNAGEIVEWATNHFDTRRLAADGLSLPARVVSALWAWHWLQSDLRKGLGAVAPFLGTQTAWKHTNQSDPAYYSAMDSLVGIRCYHRTCAALTKAGRWDSFERHCVAADPVLLRMGRAGVLLSQREKQAFISQIRADHDAKFSELQTIVPDSVRPRAYYKRLPKDLAGVRALIEPIADSKDKENDSEGVHSTPSQVSGLAATFMVAEVASAEVWACGYRYARIESFLPGSWEQVQQLAKVLKVKLPKKRDTDDPEDVSTERKYLLAPARKHRAFRLVLDCRELGKMLSTYDWPANSEGRVTTVFGWHPSTLRKSSRAINLQNIPKRSVLAKQFRRMIVASPSHTLVEGDSSAIEAVLVGYFAGSGRYITLAKSGVHGWVTSMFHGQPIVLDDPALAAKCQAAKAAWPDTYEKMKRVVHLSNYKGSPQRMAEEYPDEFPTVADARKAQNFYLDTPPGQDIRRWQQEVCLRAHHDCYLDNPFRYRHWFYNVLTWDKRSEKWIPGDDAKRAIAFLPQSTASAIQTEILLRLDTYAHLREWLRLIIHDSFVLEVPDAEVPYACGVLQHEMTQPIPQLGGLTIGCEVSAGRNWAPYDLEHNPEGMRKVTC